MQTKNINIERAPNNNIDGGGTRINMPEVTKQQKNISIGIIAACYDTNVMTYDYSNACGQFNSQGNNSCGGHWRR
jgi:hypothetical protein